MALAVNISKRQLFIPSFTQTLIREVSDRGLSHSSLVLEVTERSQSFVFEGVDAAPVPSLLRDFSAPVIVEYPYSTDELAFLVRHDRDPFNRWEAGQRLAIDAMLAVIGGAEPRRAGARLLEANARLHLRM